MQSKEAEAGESRRRRWRPTLIYLKMLVGFICATVVKKKTQKICCLAEGLGPKGVRRDMEFSVLVFF